MHNSDSRGTGIPPARTGVQPERGSSHRARVWGASVLGLAVICVTSGWRLDACEICGQPTVTLAERVSRADLVLLARWVAARAEKSGQKALTTLEVVDSFEEEGEAPAPFAPSQKLTIDGFHSGTRGSLRLLCGRRADDGTVSWDEPLEFTEAAWSYVTDAPDCDAPWSQRLQYHLRFLEHADVIVANDSHAEIVNAPSAAIAFAAESVGPEKIRGWLDSRQTPEMRKGAYWVLLGFCGTETDARRLEAQIREVVTVRRTGLQGLLFGYLQLAGEEGLKVVIDRFLATDSETDPLGETYAALRAVSWCWNNGNRRIPQQVLRETLRGLTSHRLYADQALITLAQWKDWQLLQELVESYGTGEFRSSRMKIEIVRYLIAATKDVPQGSEPESVPHVVEARGFLEQLRERDPKLVAETEKYFFLR